MGRELRRAAGGCWLLHEASQVWAPGGSGFESWQLCDLLVYALTSSLPKPNPSLLWDSAGPGCWNVFFQRRWGPAQHQPHQVGMFPGGAQKLVLGNATPLPWLPLASSALHPSLSFHQPVSGWWMENCPPLSPPSIITVTPAMPPPVSRRLGSNF